MSMEITVQGGTSKKLLTGGKYCPDDIVVTAEGGGGSGGGSVETCTVTVIASVLRINGCISTNFNEENGVHCQDCGTLSTGSYIISDVVCGSCIVIQTPYPIIPGYSVQGGAQFLKQHANLWVFSVPQSPTGEIIITIRDDD